MWKVFDNSIVFPFNSTSCNFLNGPAYILPFLLGQDIQDSCMSWPRKGVRKAFRWRRVFFSETLFLLHFLFLSDNAIPTLSLSFPVSFPTMPKCSTTEMTAVNWNIMLAFVANRCVQWHILPGPLRHASFLSMVDRAGDPQRTPSRVIHDSKGVQAWRAQTCRHSLWIKKSLFVWIGEGDGTPDAAV